MAEESKRLPECIEEAMADGRGAYIGGEFHSRPDTVPAKHFLTDRGEESQRDKARDYRASYLSKKTVEELRNLADLKGVSSRGNKSDLIVSIMLLEGHEIPAGFQIGSSSPSAPTGG